MNIAITGLKMVLAVHGHLCDNYVLWLVDTVYYRENEEANFGEKATALFFFLFLLLKTI